MLAGKSYSIHKVKKPYQLWSGIFTGFSMTALNWSAIKLVIFDVDGTLYDQKPLRRKMLAALLRYYLLRPHRLKELRLLSVFRKQRELPLNHKDSGLDEQQYHWCAKAGGYEVSLVKKVVDHWIFNFPNQFLNQYKYAGVDELFHTLGDLGIHTAIYSDYKAVAKLAAMKLNADYVLASTDPEVDRMKPDPKALKLIAQQFGLTVAQCLFIGDRDELDGACARNAGMPYLIIDTSKDPHLFYQKLAQEFINAFNLSNHGTPQPACT